jgi:hypothetical protein
LDLPQALSLAASLPVVAVLVVEEASVVDAVALGVIEEVVVSVVVVAASAALLGPDTAGAVVAESDTKRTVSPLTELPLVPEVEDVAAMVEVDLAEEADKGTIEAVAAAVDTGETRAEAPVVPTTNPSEAEIDTETAMATVGMAGTTKAHGSVGMMVTVTTAGANDRGTELRRLALLSQMGLSQVTFHFFALTV